MTIMLKILQWFTQNKNQTALEGLQNLAHIYLLNHFGAHTGLLQLHEHTRPATVLEHMHRLLPLLAVFFLLTSRWRSTSKPLSLCLISTYSVTLFKIPAQVTPISYVHVSLQLITSSNLLQNLLDYSDYYYLSVRMQVS